jgi:catechol 2,3-dioxygenase-like lactoylglutathione lyase family enzyme
VDVLSSRIWLWPSDLERGRRFYRDVLGLAIYASSALRTVPGWCSSLARGLPGVSGHPAGPAGHSVMIWIQIRDVDAGHARLTAAGVLIIRGSATEPWGLTEMWIQDPDGI